jgi:hypothetical protein
VSRGVCVCTCVERMRCRKAERSPRGGREDSLCARVGSRGPDDGPTSVVGRRVSCTSRVALWLCLRYLSRYLAFGDPRLYKHNPTFVLCNVRYYARRYVRCSNQSQLYGCRAVRAIEQWTYQRIAQHVELVLFFSATRKSIGEN